MNLQQTEKLSLPFLHQVALIIQPEEVGFPIQPDAGCSALETFPHIRLPSIGRLSGHAAFLHCRHCFWFSQIVDEDDHHRWDGWEGGEKGFLMHLRGLNRANQRACGAFDPRQAPQTFTIHTRMQRCKMPLKIGNTRICKIIKQRDLRSRAGLHPRLGSSRHFYPDTRIAKLHYKRKHRMHVMGKIMMQKDSAAAAAESRECLCAKS